MSRTTVPRHPAEQPPEAGALLRDSAGLARLLADRLCRTPSGRDHCGALHGVWQDLRCLGLAAGPDRHHDFYAESLGTLGALGARDLLVAGCADWGMLELAASSYRARAATLNATVVDRCPTPVMLCAWYGAMIGLPVRTAVADLTEYVAPASYDVICTHSLLGYPDPAGRAHLIANWYRSLRPGGAVVTVARLHPLQTHALPPRKDARSAQAFGELVQARAAARGFASDSIDLRARAERFAIAQASNPIPDVAALRGLFEARGFTFTRLDVREIPAPDAASEPVVGAARSGTYAEFVAIRN